MSSVHSDFTAPNTSALAWCESNLPKFRQKDGVSGECRCELHKDDRPSLWVGWDSPRGAFRCLACGEEGALADYAARLGKPPWPVLSGREAGSSRPQEWVYKTPAGAPLLRVARSVKDGKKTFWQSRWDGSAWLKGGLGKGSAPLLHAPELAAAVMGQTVFLVEGEKCAQRLAEAGLLATTAPEGAGKFGKVGREYLDLLLPLGVVILPDQDKPGFDHALQVARRLRSELALEAKILLLPGLGEKQDVFDWLQTRTVSALLDLVPTALTLEEFEAVAQAAVWPAQPGKPGKGEATSLDLVEDPGPDLWAEDHVVYEDRAVKAPEWEPPIPLDGRPEKPKFPIGALPGLAQEYALAVAEAFQVPVSYAASLILGAVSTATLKRVVLDPGRGPTCALNEYFLTALESGSGKSSSLSQVFAPLYRWERLAVERAQVPDGQVNEVGILSSDPTPEALENRLRANSGRFGIANPEAADLFAVLAGRYSAKGSGANIGLFLKGYSGDHHRSDRVLRGATLIREPRLTLTLALQPSAFEQVCGSAEFRDRGFMARFLTDVPESLLGHRKLDPIPVRRDLSDRWGILVNGLLGIDPPKGEDNEPEPFSVPVSPQANSRLRHFKEWSEAGLRPEGYWSECREFGARAAEHVLKLTGLVHCLKHSGKPWEYPVSEETMVAGIELFNYFAEHVRQAAGSAVERRREDRLIYLLDRIKSKPEWKTSFKVRDLYQVVKRTRGFELVENLLPELDRLSQFGYLQRLEVPTGARPSLQYKVHPKLGSLETHPQYPQYRAKPYAIELKSGGKYVPNLPPITPNSPKSPPIVTSARLGENGTQEPVVGNVGIVGDPSPTTRTLIPQGFEGDCGYCGSLSGEGETWDTDPTLSDRPATNQNQATDSTPDQIGGIGDLGVTLSPPDLSHMGKASWDIGGIGGGNPEKGKAGVEDPTLSDPADTPSPALPPKRKVDLSDWSRP